VKVKIVAVATGGEVVAEIRPACRDDVALWQRWESQMPASAEDAHWRWDEYILMAELFPHQLACFIMVAEGEAQGLTLVELEHENDLGEKDIHGLRISTAPWNRLPHKRFKYVGSLLVATVVRLSLTRGHDGRLWLESLPGAEEFYRRLGMIELSKRDPKESLVQFKFDARGAASFLRKMQEGFLE
jgi:hypothetical protein